MKLKSRKRAAFIVAVLIFVSLGLSEAAPLSPGRELKLNLGSEPSDSFFGVFFTSNEDVALECYTSTDGIHMAHLFRSQSIAGRDPSIQYYHHNFYVCLVSPEDTEETFTISRSPDLEHWTTDTYTVISRGTDCRAIWAPDLFIDEDGAAYVYFAKQRKTVSGSGGMKFDIYVARSANIETEPFSPAVKVDLPSRSDSYIDAQVRKLDGQYYMIVKNEALITGNSNKSPLLLKSHLPMVGFAEVETWPLRYIRGYEGFSIVAAGNQVFIYADSYGEAYDAVRKSGHTVWIADREQIETGPYQSAYIVSERSMRHGSVIPITDTYAKKALSKFGCVDFDRRELVGNDRKVRLTRECFGDLTSRDSQVIIEHFAPAPNTVYIVPKRTHVVIKNLENPYGVKDVSFRFEAKTDSTLCIFDQWLFHGQEAEIYTFRQIDGHWQYSNGGENNRQEPDRKENDGKKGNESDISGKKVDEKEINVQEIVIFS